MGELKMGLEIERKFLVEKGFVDGLSGGFRMKQGYIDTVGLSSVRARIKGDRGFLTIKGPRTEDGLSRPEYEYEIPLQDATQIVDSLCGDRVIEKTRYELRNGSHLWEIDIFQGKNSGLILAEVELTEIDEDVVIPGWVVAEVTGDVRFYNSRLSEHPWPFQEGN
jgi:adenylate cyclase